MKSDVLSRSLRLITIIELGSRRLGTAGFHSKKICHKRNCYDPNFMIKTCSAPQNDRLNFSFVKDTNVDGKKLARNGRKTATYYSASFPPYYRRVLISHLLVFNRCILPGLRNHERRTIIHPYHLVCS